MKIGCCATLESAASVKAAGFAYLEVGVQPALQAHKSDAEWRDTAEALSRSPLPIEAANSLLPRTLPVVGPARDPAALQQYMAVVAERAAKVGIQRLVFGSGAARRRPDDVAPDEAFKQIVEFTRMAGDACARHGLLLVIEHLHRGETNTINSLEQERELIETANHPAVAALVDSYHYGLEQETDQALLELGNTLQHVHVAEPIDRIQPGGHGESDKAFDFDTFFALLRKMGYNQRISFEGNWTRSLEQDGAACVKLLRDTWERAGSVMQE